MAAFIATGAVPTSVAVFHPAELVRCLGIDALGGDGALDMASLMPPRVPAEPPEPALARALDPVDALEIEYREPNLEGVPRLSLWATHYSIPRVKEVSEGVALLDLEGRELGPSLEPRDFCLAAVAGTVEVATKRSGRRLYRFEAVSDEEAIDCTTYFPRNAAAGRSRFSDAGTAADGMVRLANGDLLVAHRTIAVDPALIPLGSVVYIPAARGTKIRIDSERTRIHDGYFYAVDTGGAIEGAHIDVFLGFASKNPFAFVRSSPNAVFDAYVIDDLDMEDALAELHHKLPTRAIAVR